MSKKADYLFRVAVATQLADERSTADPMNRLARRYARGVRLLFQDAIRLPEDHELFDAGVSACSGDWIDLGSA